jgi:hypothetical protein
MYKAAGIFRVTALAENSLGFDTTTLHLHVTCTLISERRAAARVSSSFYLFRV